LCQSGLCGKVGQVAKFARKGQAWNRGLKHLILKGVPIANPMRSKVDSNRTILVFLFWIPRVGWCLYQWLLELLAHLISSFLHDSSALEELSAPWSYSVARRPRLGARQHIVVVHNQLAGTRPAHLRVMGCLAIRWQACVFSLRTRRGFDVVVSYRPANLTST
jgi:hypothetical protein